MLRGSVRALLAFILRIFFRRIEVTGRGNVPADGPVLFCANHPNALVDPLVLMVTAPRPVSFLAKAPLFTMPVIGWFARALDAIPVYRAQDFPAGRPDNAGMFAAARAVLDAGGAIGIFPEGTSHSDPDLKPLKTGAARLALGAGTARPVQIVPVALNYTAKSTFRSSALVCYGEPIAVQPIATGATGEPPPDQVAAVTDTIAAGMREHLVVAQARETLELATQLERLFLSVGDEGARSGLAESAQMRRRLLAAYPDVVRRKPVESARLRARLDRHDARLQGAGLEPVLLTPQAFSLPSVLGYSLRAAAYFTLAGPLALPGIVIHYPAYRLVGFLARQVAGESQDVVATAKALGALLLFPLTWGLIGWAVASWLGWPAGVAAMILAPVTGWIGLHFSERFDHLLGATRALLLYHLGRERFLRLQVERRRLREEVMALAREAKVVG
ncbi:MAG TPA: lysophospholipid acyltransferase family protein [Gemmatimonadales bacterium]|nr:lysophospholipid acyltransferase family protein [Gemmatimonadales bacterium]